MTVRVALVGCGTVARVTMSVRGARAGLYDARGYTQDWAKNDSLFWMGQQGLTVRPGETTEITADWRFDP